MATHTGALTGVPSAVGGNELILWLQDWRDIDFALAQDVDFIAISFVKSADVINNLKSYVSSRAKKTIEIISKVESFDSVPNIQEIVEASDGVMVARGDLGELTLGGKSWLQGSAVLAAVCCHDLD